MSFTFNRLALSVLMMAAALPSAVLAWPPGGIAVAPVPGRVQFEPRVLLGQDGSVFAFWSDGRWLGNLDTYGQLLTRYGQVAPGWPDTGLMVARARDDQRPVSGLSHPDGSFIVGIADYRNTGPGGTDRDQYLARVLPDGRVDPTWPRHGFQATDRPGGDSPYRMVWAAPDTLVTLSGYGYPDGVGRLLFQSVAVTPVGPQALWGTSGVLYQWRPTGIFTTAELAPDGAGGVFTVFDDVVDQPDPNTILDTDLWVMRLGRDGQPAAGWESGARPVSVVPGLQEYAAIVADGSGGLYVAWVDARDGPGLAWPDYLAYEDIRLLHLTPEGTPHPGWPADGLLVSNAPGWQSMPSLLLDGTGGVYVAWDDITIGITHVRGDGTFAPGWGQNGIQISDLYAYATESRMVLDGFGGVFVFFEDFSASNLYLQHVLSSGAVDPNWPSTGELVSFSSGGDIASDGAGGCYVAFLKPFDPLQPTGPWVVHVARYSVQGPVPVRLAEATVEAEVGRVHLVWRGAEAAASEVQVQRLQGSAEAWQTLGAPTARGRDELEYDDLTVEPGARYAYRLVRGGTEVVSQEQWVTVPAAPVFALAGARPNPALAQELTVAFSLAGAGAARLEVLDLAGRREHVRMLTGLAAGRHTLSLAEARLAPGVHWLRLTEGVREAHVRVIVVR